MSGLVRATVTDTIRLLSGLIANPEAIDQFAEFLARIGHRHFVMTVNDGCYRSPITGIEQLGTVVTITVHDSKGMFELLQGFFPIAEEMFMQTGKRYFTDFIEPEFSSILLVESE